MVRLDMNKIVGKKKDDLLHEIIRLRDDYIFRTGELPTKIKMSRATFSRIDSYADCYGFLLCIYDEFAREMKYRLCAMDVVFDEDEKGVEVYDM